MNDKELSALDGVLRVETTPLEVFQHHAMERTHTVYDHDEIFGDFCPVQLYVDCPPEGVFEYMSYIQSLNEWSYSTRFFRAPNEDGLYRGHDAVGGKNTVIYGKVAKNREALTIDYHCAWDQGDELWMIYLNRIVDAQLVLGKPGSVIFWQNCKHPYYDKNPYPELEIKGRPWVGEMWDYFYAGHMMELENLKAILEHLHANNLPMKPSMIGCEQ